MVFCNVIINFKDSDFEKLSESISLSDCEIFTDDISIKQKGKELGLKIDWLEEYFGYGNDRTYSIYEKAISAMKAIESAVKNITYKNVSLYTSLRYDIVIRLVLLEEVREILTNKKNVLFLFRSLQHNYFSIPHIAKELGYDIGLGVSEFMNSRIKNVDFQKDAATSFDYLYQSPEKLILLDKEDSFTEYSHSCLDNIINKDELLKTRHAFFLVDNTWELMLKPIFPILEQFLKNNTPFVVFSLNKEATTHLKERGYNVYDLNTQLYELLYKALSRIYHFSEEDRKKIREDIEAKFKIETDKITNDILRLEKSLGIEKKSLPPHIPTTMPLIDEEEKLRKTNNQNNPTFSEKLYFAILNRYLRYSKQWEVRLIGKISKSVFIRLEKKVKKQMKLRELQLKKEMEELKKKQKEKELEIADQIRNLKREQSEKSRIRNKEEKELSEKRMLLLKIELEKEISIKNMFDKTPVTSLQYTLSKLFENLKNMSFAMDKDGYYFNQYLLNDTVVLYLAKSLATIALCNEIFEHGKFDSILVSSGSSSDIDIVCDIARNHGVPNYLMTVHPYEEYFPISKVVLNADKILVAGDRLKEELQHLGINEKRLIVTGNPKFDFLNQVQEKNKAERSTSVNNRPLVVVANSRWNDDDDGWMSELIKYCNKNDLRILIKVHPVYKHWKTELNDMMIQRIKEKCIGLKYEITIDASLPTLLSQASALITEFSWTGFEASLLDVPLVVINFQEKTYSQYALLYHKEGIALYSTKLQELFENINKIINDNEIKEKLTKARKKLNYDFNYLNDGKAAERIFRLLTTGTV